MKILLINSNQFKQPWPVLPFGLCYVASSLENAGNKVKVLDLNFVKNKDIKKTIDKTIEHFHPEIIGVSIRNIDNGAGFNTLFLLEDVKNNIITPLKKYNTEQKVNLCLQAEDKASALSFSSVSPSPPKQTSVFKQKYKSKGLGDIPIVIGGGAIGINAKEILDYFQLDYAIRGDGEHSFLEFIKRLEKNISLKNSPSLVYRKNKKIIENPISNIENIDLLPFPKVYRWIDLKLYRKYNVSIPIQTKRGCELKCSYCVYNEIEGKRFRLRDPKKVVEEIVDIIKNSTIKKISFNDSVLNIPINHFKEILREIIKRKINAEFETLGLNPGGIDRELLELMKKAGFSSVDIGADSASDICLRTLKKNFSKRDLIKTALLLKELKIPTQWYFLLGSSSETKETIKETFDFIDTYIPKTDLVNIGIGIRIYKGSKIAEDIFQDKAMGNINKIDNTENNGLLMPLCLEPDLITIKNVKYLIKKQALKRKNVFMYDEDENTPLFILKLGFFLLRIFDSKSPIWKFFIIKRKIENILGVNRLKLILLNRARN